MFSKGLLSVGSSTKGLSKGGGIGIGYRHVYERFTGCRYFRKRSIQGWRYRYKHVYEEFTEA